MNNLRAPRNLLQGQAGVYRVASMLCLRGLNPHFPAVDIGADLIVDGGLRIQVKSANLRTDKVYPNGAYWFRLGKPKPVKGQITWVTVDFDKICEFVVFWGITEDRFWIVPSLTLRDHQCLVLGPKVGYPLTDMATVSKMLGDGATAKEIAKAVGVSERTVHRLLNNETQNKREFAHLVRPCEDRWDHIDSCVNALQQIGQNAVFQET